MKILNPFVEAEINIKSMPAPTIPAHLGESYSQCYEDVILDSMLRAYVKTNGAPAGITFVEIGANHPVCTSSSFLFRNKYKMKTILVEANPKLIPALKQFRPLDEVIHAAVINHDAPTVDFYVSENNETSSLDDRFVITRTPGIQEKITVPTIRADEILDRVDPEATVLLSVDVEGLDLQILQDIDFTKHRPIFIIVEPSEDYQPGSTVAIIDFLISKNYNLVAETDVNLIFQTQ
jgi:FkbM family methyltransferase